MKLLYFLLLPALLTAQQIQFPQDTLARNERFNNREFAVYDKTGKMHVSYTGQLDTDGSTREIYYVKENNDGTFTTSKITNNAVDDNYATLSVDNNNKLHCGFEGKEDGTNFQILYSNNISGGFSNPIFITTGGLNKATPYSKVGPDSVVHFVYYTYTAGNDSIFYRSFSLKDSLLSPEISLGVAEADGDFEASLDVDHTGKAHIVFRSGTSIWGGPLKYITVQYQPFAWTIVTIFTGITNTVSTPRIVLDKQENPVIIFKDETVDRMCITKKSGSTFTTPIFITPVGQYPSNYQNFAIDDSNYCYIVYQSSQSASGKGFFLVYGKDNNFSDTLRIYDLTSEYVTRNSSHVLARGKGDIALFYAPAGMRNGLVACDVFMKRGNIFGPVPVELVSFTASAGNNNKVTLHWSTASEKNNYGFDVERQSSTGSWQKIAFVAGKGTTFNNSSYSYTDAPGMMGNYSYRLKQVDLDGTFEYSNTIEIEIGLPSRFSLEQNYPNPFNPSTIISYSLPVESNVQLTLYDVLGNQAAILVNEQQPAGTHSFHLDAGKYNLSSGVYLYRINAGEFTSEKKLVLIK